MIRQLIAEQRRTNLLLSFTIFFGGGLAAGVDFSCAEVEWEHTKRYSTGRTRIMNNPRPKRITYLSIEMREASLALSGSADFSLPNHATPAALILLNVHTNPLL